MVFAANASICTASPARASAIAAATVSSVCRRAAGDQVVADVDVAAVHPDPVALGDRDHDVAARPRRPAVMPAASRISGPRFG